MESAEPTWQPHERHGSLATQSDLPDTVFAFPEQRKEPLTDATHVRNSVARFNQVSDVSDTDRALAFANIEKAAQYYNVDLSETNWRQLGVHPQLNREESAKARAKTRMRTSEVEEAAVAGAARETLGIAEEAAKNAATTGREHEENQPDPPRPRDHALQRELASLREQEHEGHETPREQRRAEQLERRLHVDERGAESLERSDQAREADQQDEEERARHRR